MAAAIIVLAVTIGSWVLDFTAAGHSGVLGWLSQISLTQTLRPFEQHCSLCRSHRRNGRCDFGFHGPRSHLASTRNPNRTKVAALRDLCSRRMRRSRRRHIPSSHVRRDRGPPEFIRGDRSTATRETLWPFGCHSQPGSGRSAVSGSAEKRPFKIERAVPNVTVNLAGRMNNTDADRYGEVDYAYAGRTDMSRSTSPREILPLIYGLAGLPPPSTLAASDYPGYPLVMDTRWAMPWFFGLLPLAIVIFWWATRRPPKISTPPKESNREKPSPTAECHPVHVRGFLRRHASGRTATGRIHFSNETVGAEAKSFPAAVVHLAGRARRREEGPGRRWPTVERGPVVGGRCGQGPRPLRR